MKEVSIHISSLTGNTRKISDSIINELKNNNIKISTDLNYSSKEDKSELIIVCFWCRKSSLDNKSKSIIDSLKNKRILLFGTMGGYPTSEYGKRVKENVIEYVNQNNHCVDVYLSQGKVSLARTEYRRNLPKESPHHLDEEGVKRHLESQNHPNQNDIDEAVKLLRKILNMRIKS